MEPPVVGSPVTEIIGVYDADSTLIGEIRYWVGARFGRAHCSLCDLTHGLFTRKRDWAECSMSLGVPVVTHHRDDAPADVLAAAAALPVVMARTPSGLVTILDPARLAALDGSTEKFVAFLRDWVSGSA